MQNFERIRETNCLIAQNCGTISSICVDKVAAFEPVFRAHLAEAVGCAEMGTAPLKATGEFDLPEELLEAPGADPALAEVFQNLTWGC